MAKKRNLGKINNDGKVLKGRYNFQINELKSFHRYHFDEHVREMYI